jgi:flagellar biosynthesis protein FlhB
MANDSGQEKTEQATPRRRQEAAAEGRVPRSPELGTATLLLMAALTMQAIAPAASSRIIDLFGGGLRRLGAGGDVSPDAVVAILQGMGRELLFILVLLTASFAVAAVTIGALQARGVLSGKPLGPNWERINPLTNGKRLLSVQPIVDLLKSLLKLGIVSWAVWHALSAAWPDLIDLAGRDPRSLLDTIRHYSAKLLLTAGLAYLALALSDYLYQVWQYEKGLRMSKTEVKQETKQQDGDPMLKSRMRSVARARLRRQMFKDVAKADVVIVNPTHIAIALQYDPAKAPAPFVLAMGQRKIAERIKQLAFEHGIPVVENRPLARALLGVAQVGMMIPAELYAAVAEVLAFVLRQRALRGVVTKWAGQASQ